MFLACQKSKVTIKLKFYYSNLKNAVETRGVQIRSETDPIRSDFGTKIFISDRIDKVVS
jgi:hypothetical protein